MTSIPEVRPVGRYNSIIIELVYGIPHAPLDTPQIDLTQLAQRLKVLSDPKRLLILHRLMEGVQCNCELGDAWQMPANLISHHLRILREAGLVTVERDVLDGRWIYYAVNPMPWPRSTT